MGKNKKREIKKLHREKKWKINKKAGAKSFIFLLEG
jgi:hypothetical protein